MTQIPVMLLLNPCSHPGCNAVQAEAFTSAILEYNGDRSRARSYLCEQFCTTETTRATAVQSALRYCVAHPGPDPSEPPNLDSVDVLLPCSSVTLY